MTVQMQTGNATQWVDETMIHSAITHPAPLVILVSELKDLLLLTDMVVPIPTVMVTLTLVQDGPPPTVRMLSSMSQLNGLTKMVMATETMQAE